ncbi:MAG: glycosyltransferase [Luteimonas sp.]
MLSLRGAALPERVLPANAGNETGYWEPERIVAFNERLLAAAGLAWNDAFAPGPEGLRRLEERQWRDEARRIVTEEYGDAALLVLKDPRCTLLQDFWREVLGSLGIAMLPVVMARPPGEVVASLVRRDGGSALGASFAYARYGIAAAAAGAPAAFLTYAQLMRDWRGETDGLADRLGFHWPTLPGGEAARIDAFLASGRKQAPVVEISAPLASLCEDTWACLEARAQGGRSQPAQLAALSRRLEEAAGSVVPLLRDKNRQLGAARAELEGMLQRERQLHGLFEEARDGLARTAGERDTALAERDRALAAIEAAEGRLRESQAAHAATARERDAALSERDAALAAIEGAEARLSESQAAHAATAQDRDAALAERDKALASIEAAEGRLRESQAAHAATARERDAALSERDNALAAIEAAEGRLRESQAAHAVTARERDAALSERDKALAAIEAAEGRLRDSQAAHAATARERDAALAERDNALVAIEAAEGRLRDSQSAHAATARERDTALSERDEALRERNEALQTVEEIRDLLREAREEQEQVRTDLGQERDRLLALYRSTDELLQKAQSDFNWLEQRHRALDADYATLSSFTREILASRSWRLTARLRRIARRVRGVAGEDWPMPALTALDPPERAHAQAAGDDGAPSAQAPAVPQSLSDFLFDEFGADAARDVVSRIRHYRLPVDTREVRAAAALECTEEQALAWAAAISALAPPEAEDAAPDVSIVVPVYNQLPHTLALLDSLLSHRTRYRFEVLVGDDASTDATAAALAVPIPGVRHVRHARNLGFVRNCNATAAEARGRYVLFLNNDTQVLPGWLDELVGALEADPRIGLAGSKLVYPDGRLQECGAIVWRDGSAWNYGRLQDPRRPEFCYLRDVDYVSGASIALSRELWRELGGFDELFVPAYAEDADLAFRVRALGLRTVVQPLSQLLHFEGVSSGTDLGAGAKAYQVENLRKLHERWKDALAGHRDNADAPELEKERGVRGRVLFLDHCTPTPHEDAGSLVAFETMAAFLAEGYKVTFIPEDNFAHMGADTRDLQRIGVEAVYHPAYSRMDEFLARRDDPFDVVFLHRFGVGEAHMSALRKRYRGARFLFLNADMHHLREMREAELSGDAAAMARAGETRARELAVVRAADATLVHSTFEQALLEREAPDARVALYPLIHEPAADAPTLLGRTGVCFVGGFRHPPNADAIAWFADAVWPLVLAELPEATLHVVGSHMPPEVAALGERQGVVIEGFVADLDAYLARRRASGAPLRYGAGAKGKVAGSLALGVPVACTGIAAEGMGLAEGEEVLVADSPGGLAAHVLQLLRDDEAWYRLSAGALEWARRTTSRASARERLRALLG